MLLQQSHFWILLLLPLRTAGVRREACYLRLFILIVIDFSIIVVNLFYVDRLRFTLSGFLEVGPLNHYPAHFLLMSVK